MSNKRFEMHEIRQIIFRLRQGESIRGIARAKLADRKKIRKINHISIQQGWLLESNTALPTDEELSKFFKPKQVITTQSLILPYQNQIEEWFKQGIQASTIHAALKRQYNFVGGYNVVQRFIKKIK